jgi:hypothetical protein
MKVRVEINRTLLMTLLDSGSTHNFIDMCKTAMTFGSRWPTVIGSQVQGGATASSSILLVSHSSSIVMACRPSCPGRCRPSCISSACSMAWWGTIGGSSATTVPSSHSCQGCCTRRDFGVLREGGRHIPGSTTCPDVGARASAPDVR